MHLRVVLGAASLALTTAPPRSLPAPYDVQRLADGVYALVRHDPEAFANNANSLIIIGDRDVVVVDAQFTRAATTETIAAIRGLTAKPVRYVINTHWHDDHAAGNQVYRDSFPEVEFVAHENTRRDLATIGAKNREATWGAAGPYVARLERLMAAGLGADSTPIVPLERVALEHTVSILRGYLADRAGFRETLPTITYTRTLVLRRAAPRVELRWFGPASTQGDAIVYLPDQHIIAVGDLLGSPVPFAFGSYPSGWIAVLDSIRALEPAVIVTGHGPVLDGDAYLLRVQQMIRRIRDETKAAVASGATIEEVRRRVQLTDARDSIAHGDKWLNTVFDSFFLRPLVQRAYEDATGSLR